MAGKSKKDPLEALMAIPGVGKATAKKLSDAGIKSAAGIKKAGQKGEGRIDCSSIKEIDGRYDSCSFG